MSVIGHWRRSALGAGGVALLLPLGLALGVALTAALGGEARLRALGQVVAGPDAPARVAEPGLEASRNVPSVPVRRRATQPVGLQNPADSRVLQPTTGGEPTQPDTRTPSSPDPVTQPDQPSQPTQPEQPGTDPEPQQPQGSALNETAQGVADTVAGVPVVGDATDDAMQTVVDLIP
jgi:hypothetical protein